MNAIFLFFLTLLAPQIGLGSQTAKIVKKESESPVFRLHLLGETYNLDPAQVSGASGSYLFHNIIRGLYRFDASSGLTLDGAKSCNWKSSLELTCELKSQKFSNGEPILAKNYLLSFQRIVDPKNKGVHLDLLQNILNATKVFSGQLKPDALGVRAETKGLRQFVTFLFERPDPEFEFKLALPQLGPAYSDSYPGRDQAQKFVGNGPYKILNWNPGRSVQLTANPSYGASDRPRPEVEFLFIDDDETALRLYEANRLSLLRRLPSQHIEKMRTRSDFLQIPMARFDYLGFGPTVRGNKNLRIALAKSLNYEELKKILHAKGRPGCPSLPPRLLQDVPCLEFDVSSAKTHLQKALLEGAPSKWKLQYSKMGGEDIKRQVEWYQHQWKQNLGLEFELEGIEQGMLIKTLQVQPTEVFRKGQTLERPTCLSALEMFYPGHPENYPLIQNSKLNQIIEKLRQPSRSTLSKKKLCTDAVKILVEEALIIPLGEIHFTMLARPQWSGWSINELNQLDLTELQFRVSE